jgi:RHS repeat-associated protein
MKEGNVFEAEIDVTAGENIFTITAADLKGNTSFKRYKVDVSTGEASYSYDNNGNLTDKTDDGHTWAYEWTVENQLARVTYDGAEMARFAYDPLGRRVEKVAGGITTSWMYDGQDILRETRGGITTTYVHGPGIDEPLAKIDQTGGALYLHADGLGSIVKETNAVGEVVLTRQYDAWGNLESGADQPGYAFTGREWDPETGLYYYRARYYDPRIGRFVSEDPIGFKGGMNFYAYVKDSPTQFRDPSGESLWRTIFRIFAKEGKHYRQVRQVQRASKPAVLREVRRGIQEAGEGCVVRTRTQKARDALARALSEDKRLRGPERSPGYPEHVHPNAGPNTDVHIQTAAPGAGAVAGAGLGSLLAANAMAMADAGGSDPAISTGDVIVAGAWDVASAIDPIFLTDLINWVFGVGE